MIFRETGLMFWMLLLVTPTCSKLGSTEFGIWTNRGSTAEPLASGSSISNLEMGFNKLALVGLYAAPEGPVPIWKTWIPFCNTMQTSSHPEYKSTVLRHRGWHIRIPKKNYSLQLGRIGASAIAGPFSYVQWKWDSGLLWTFTFINHTM